jgi:hypothetical protein
MFGSSLPPVVGKRAHVFFMLFVFVCLLLCPTLIVLCFFTLSSSMFPVSLVYPFLFARYSLTFIFYATNCSDIMQIFNL